MQWVALMISLLVGMFISIQGVLNSSIGKFFSLPAMIFSVSIIQAFIVLFFLYPQFHQGVTALTHPPVWIAGLLGVCIMFGIAYSLTKNGALLTFVLVIFGQLILSALLDHFGWLGITQKPITLQKLISLGTIALGIWLLFTSE